MGAGESPAEASPGDLRAELIGHQLELQLGHLCNNRCVFCSSGLLTELGLARPVAEEPLLTALEDGRRRGATRVTFLGGEPTLHQGFLRALERATSLGFEEIVIFTNGMRLAEEGFVDSVLALDGPISWRVSIQGGDEAAHDAATGTKGAFARIVAGLQRLQAKRQKVTSNICVNEESYRSLGGFPSLVRRYGIRQLHVDVVRPASSGYQDGATGVRSLEHLRSIMPRYSEMVPYLRGMLEEFEREQPAFDVNVGNLPYCVMPEWEQRIHHGGELTLTRAAGVRQLEDEADKYAVHYSQRQFLPGCEQCSFRPRCSGIFNEYLELYGGDEFRPVPATASVPVSNSLDYVPVRRLEDFRLDARACSATTLGLSRAGSSRVVIVGWEGEYLLCRTRTRDFDDREIRGAVHGCGQLYLDRTGKTDVEDLREVEQLVLSAECRSCPELPSCVGAYVPEHGRSRFEEDEAFVREKLLALSGRVLDVGMGHLPYLDILDGALRSGRVEYHGVDPDAAAVARAQATGLPLSVQAVGIEAFAAAPASFDHALAIRSAHHFADLDRALGVLCAALKPGGRILLVESLPLPLVRSAADSRKSQHESRGGFQHYRNWDSYRFLEHVLGRYPLEPVFHRPVSRDTCDQWILELARTTSAAS